MGDDLSQTFQANVNLRFCVLELLHSSSLSLFPNSVLFFFFSLLAG